MSNKKIDHVHKYFKTQFTNSKTTIFRCGLSGCSHFLYEPLVIGRISICWRCQGEFVITRKTIVNKKLHCEDCTRGRTPDNTKELIDELFKFE